MRLRQDYRSAMEELQTSNEELRSVNEELHSSNEELQSTNEELESSREELQSLNEELNTVNSELNNKIDELNEAYKATNAVLNNTRIAIVFLDNELKIKRFTPRGHPAAQPDRIGCGASAGAYLPQTGNMDLAAESRPGAEGPCRHR